MRKKIAAANWKMNLGVEAAKALVNSISNHSQKGNIKVNIYAPYVYLPLAIEQANGKLNIGAQNCHEEDKGAYTGEIAAAMLQEIGCKSVIIGHSERRVIYKETDQLINAKIQKARAHNLEVVFCIGELLAERESNTHFNIIESQLKNGLANITLTSDIVIAYEPVWAIGTGKTASPEQAEEMHLFIRNWIEKNYNSALSEEISILYGGSCNAKNADQIFAMPNIDGGLVGGASLVAEDFIQIINALQNA